MNPLLSALWRGELCPVEGIGRDPTYHRLQRAVCEAEAQLKQQLSEAQLTALEEYEDACMERLTVENEIVFAKGFRLGVRLLLAALCEE